MQFVTKVKSELKNLYPGYFALVMATGIIETACRQLHFEQLASLLFFLNNGQFIILLLLLTSRVTWFFPQVKEDVTSHKKGAGFLTIIAASCVLGSEYVQGQHSFSGGTLLLLFALIAWTLLLYTFLSLTILQKEKPSPETGLNGSWLLIVVSTQSLVILAASLSDHLPVNPEITFFTTLTAWLVSILFYVVLLTLLFYRLTFYRVTPAEITPDYWIDTGAAAISALAGVTLINASDGLLVVQQYIPIIKLLCVLLWGAATFWLPLLCILETWRHVKSGFKYNPAYWSLVFPLGMYTVASLKLSPILETTFPGAIGHIFIYVALVAWIFIFIAMVHNIINKLTVNRDPGYSDMQ
ncbi:MAG: tellurite resistance/C4-dicarboxylate transporter family protein [Bacteroidota bacterium]|nr:tellurite resistance/C4-dicarboxylate transporter family protein [Bacteroidota bacterium]